MPNPIEPMTEARLKAIEQYNEEGAVTQRGISALIAEIRRLQAEIESIRDEQRQDGIERDLLS